MDILVNGVAKNVAHQGVWKCVRPSSSISVASYRTDLNIAGQGWLLFGSIWLSNTTAANQNVGFRITIDGGTAYLIGGFAQYYAPAVTLSNSRGGHVFPFDVYFSSSLLVEAYNGDSPATVNTNIHYLLA